jgi:hypothetical protein
VNFNDKNDEEISSKLVSIKQELKLQTTVAINIDASTFIEIKISIKINFFIFIFFLLGVVKNPVRQTLQFVPTASFDKSNEAVSKLVSKIQGLLKSKDWDQFAAAQFVDITNELRRMDKTDLNTFKSNADIK